MTGQFKFPRFEMKSMGWRVPVLNLLLYSYFVPDLILDAAYSSEVQT